MPKKRFVCLVNSETDEQIQAFRAYVKETRMGYWHWLQSSWLLTDPDGLQTSESLRDQFQITHPKVHVLVIEISGNDHWSGYGPQGDDRNMFKWLRTTWKRDIHELEG
ncbi:MAG: hypothetical protein QM796_02455 [Chthoniobacteraceae bacterium]